MDKALLAEIKEAVINGEMDKELTQRAYDNNLVIIRGYSDDIVDFTGAFYNEIDVLDKLEPTNNSMLEEIKEEFGEDTYNFIKNIELTAEFDSDDSDYIWSFSVKPDLPQESIITTSQSDPDEKTQILVVDITSIS